MKDFKWVAAIVLCLCPNAMAAGMYAALVKSDLTVEKCSTSQYSPEEFADKFHCKVIPGVINCHVQSSSFPARTLIFYGKTVQECEDQASARVDFLCHSM